MVYTVTFNPSLDYIVEVKSCLLYTSDAADEEDSVNLEGRRIIKKNENKSNRGTCWLRR